MELQKTPTTVINLTIGAAGSVVSTIEHNHTGGIRERSQCPACDQIHRFYSEGN